MPDMIECKEVLLEKWDVNWPILNVLISGKSSIDLPQLYVESLDDANRFIINYGYDPVGPKDARHIHAVIIEALHFIEKVLIPKEWKKGLRPPKEILNCRDVRKLLVWASDESARIDRRREWSCSVLRVMHTIAHIGDITENSAIEAARNQIFSEFEKMLFRKGDGSMWFGDERKGIPVERVEWKYSKSRESIILKLLHKPANVAETIFDRLGIRIVTKKPLDALVMVQFLRDFFLVTFPNTTPARSKNTLIDLEKFKPHLDLLWAELNEDKIGCAEFLQRIDEDYGSARKDQTNPHSSISYKSIQLTCRQLIHYPNPSGIWKSNLLNFLERNKKSLDPKLSDFTKEIIDYAGNWDGSLDREESAFFPFEVQILHTKVFKQIETGAASHDRYKKSQIRTARKRVLGTLL